MFKEKERENVQVIRIRKGWVTLLQSPTAVKTQAIMQIYVKA